MGATWLIHSLTTTPFFAARAFLATFFIALACRFAPELAPLVDADVAKLLSAAPAWFTHDVTLVALGLMAALEFAATRDPDARALMNEIDPLLKSGFAFITTYGLLDADVSTLQPALSGFHPVALWAFVPAGLVFFMASARARVLRSLHDVDLDDDLGVQKLFVWLEDLFVAGGLLLAVVLPILAVFVFASALVGMFLMQAAVRWLDDRTREPCPSCDALVHPTAPACGGCGEPRAEVRAVGLFGQARSKKAPAPDAHRLDLVTRGRCSACAERLGSRSPEQACGVCGAPAGGPPPRRDFGGAATRRRPGRPRRRRRWCRPWRRRRGRRSRRRRSPSRCPWPPWGR